jgi:lysophospholipid acyltransferase (LPLAT)-like uncharacterized protein
MKAGAPYLAIQAGATVIPTTAAAARAWTFRSWDRFMVPKPFARVVLLWGDPIIPPSDSASLDAFTLTLEQALNDLTARADELARRS